MVPLSHLKTGHSQSKTFPCGDNPLIKIDLNILSEDFSLRLQQLLKVLQPEKMLDEAGALLLNRMRRRFLAETDPFGNKWIPSQSSIRRRKRGGTGTLFATGRLFHSIQLAGTGPNQRFIGSDVMYGKHHQYGTPKLPVRMFLGFNDADATAVEALLRRRLQAAAK